MVVIDPRIDGPRSISTRVQGLDLFSTILSLAGVDPVDDTESVDLTPAIFGDLDALDVAGLNDRVFHFHSGRAGYLTPKEHEGHVLKGASDGRFKTIRQLYGEDKQEMFFDLRTDPEELKPLNREQLVSNQTELPGWLRRRYGL